MIALLAPALLGLGLGACNRKSPAATLAKVKFGANVGDDGKLQDESTEFPAMTQVSFAAGPLTCAALSLTWRLLEVRGGDNIVDTKDENGHDIVAPTDEGTIQWEAGYHNVQNELPTIKKPGAYEVRVLCGAVAVASGRLRISCPSNPQKMSEWDAYLSQVACIDKKYVCEHFRLGKGVELDVWPDGVQGGNDPYGLVARFALLKYFAGVREAVGCPLDAAKPDKSHAQKTSSPPTARSASQAKSRVE